MTAYNTLEEIFEYDLDEDRIIYRYG